VDGDVEKGREDEYLPWVLEKDLKDVLWVLLHYNHYLLLYIELFEAFPRRYDVLVLHVLLLS